MIVKLRKLENKDANFMLEWMRDSQVINFLRINGKEKTVRDCEEFIEKAQDLSKTAHFAVADVNTDEYYGTVSLKNIDAEKGEAEYAIATRSKVHGTGAAASATRQILDYAFLTLKLNRVYLNVLSENIRAKKFYGKMGFAFVKTDNAALDLGGEGKDLDWFEIRREKYLENKPLVTCVVTVYKKFDYLFDGLKSVFSQDYPKIELIVADDGSENFPEKKIVDFIENNKKENIVRYEVIHNIENIGTVKNMNGAYKKSHGRYFIGLDGDDVFYNETVMSRVVERFLTLDADFIVCTRAISDEDLNVKRLLPDDKNLKRYFNKNGSIKKIKYYNKLEISGSCMYYSLKFIQKYGYFDERFKLTHDSPLVAYYLQKNEKVDTAYDIISIKYRLGGVTSAGGKTEYKASPTGKKLFDDRITFTREYIIGKKRFYVKKDYDRECFTYYWETAKTKKERLKILLKYPSKLFKLIFKKTVY